MLASLSLPIGVQLARTTPWFTAETVPAGLLRSHRIAAGVWGRLRVDDGEVTFAVEATGESRCLRQGDSQVIEPDVAHHVVVGRDGRFCVEFYK